MNALFVIRATGSFSTQQAQLELFYGLQKKGLNIFLLGELSENVISFLNDKNLPYYNIYPNSKIDRNYIKEFQKIIEKHTINIVHFVDGKASRSGLIALKKYPTIKITTYYGSVSLHWYDPSAYLTYLHPRINAIIGNSNYVYTHIKKQLFGKSKQKVVRIFKGYNPDWFKDILPLNFESIGIPKDVIIVCSVGNHRKIKGTNFFLESSNFLETKKEVHYVLIGHNTDASHLTKIAKNSKITDRIHFLGSKTNVIFLIKNADIYAQTSI